MRPTESGRIRIAWAKRKGSIKRQGFKRYSRHEGLAPVRLSKGPNRFGLFCERISCRTSDRSACLFPRGLSPRTYVPGSVDRGAPFSRSSAPRPPGRTDRARTSAIMKRRQPFTCLNNRREPKANTEGPTMNPGRTWVAYFCAAFEAVIGFKKRNRVGSA